MEQTRELHILQKKRNADNVVIILDLLGNIKTEGVTALKIIKAKDLIAKQRGRVKGLCSRILTHVIDFNLSESFIYRTELDGRILNLLHVLDKVGGYNEK